MFAGLLVWLPIWAIVVVLRLLIRFLNSSLALLPAAYQPDNLVGFHIPGLGVIFSLLIFILTGVFVSNFLGHKLVALWDRFINRIPLISSVHSAVKQVLQSILHSKGKSFQKVFIVQYPRPGMWSLAFQTGDVAKSISHPTGEDLVALFIPTTPNPTSGFLLMAPRSDVIELDLSVDEALKMVISLGVVQPQA